MPATRVPLSILDLVPVSEGMTMREALDSSVEMAERADDLGYHRYWYAEHHNVPTFASSATSLLIGRAAERTTRIRLGAGGVMLPNHSPLMVAEYYGTLAEMHGDRIDLGLGRAPGTDPRTAAALRRGEAGADTFVQDVVELQRYLAEGGQRPDGVTALPGQGTEVPLWMLGSSLDGATVAAALGLPYVFASHFAPAARHEALRLYRSKFSTEYVTAEIERPYAMAGVNVLVAPTDEEARRLFTTHQLLAAQIGTGRRGPLPAPVDNLGSIIPAPMLAFIDDFLKVQAVGSPETAVRQLEAIVDDLGVDELIITTYTHDPAMRTRSFELLAEAWGR